MMFSSGHPNGWYHNDDDVYFCGRQMQMLPAADRRPVRRPPALSDADRPRGWPARLSPTHASASRDQNTRLVKL
ncbi:unnamed protein product [Euphydryas editha]|uniref:Uncharacterized protein n=1 Tax=Euphydryas editha TaxID=104508 RepID=A0AAU9VC32_EUPED|nr:unnamed protein product [Euphydryas editha]